MKETTVINRIKKLVDNVDYSHVYFEIETKNDKYTFEKDKDREVIGFKKSIDK